MRFLLPAFVLTVGLTFAGTASAGTLPGKGPNPSWTEMQKREWYLGYMSGAAAICRFYQKSADLAALAALTPYGRIGLSGISGDGFYGAACQGIGKEADALLGDAAALRRYFSDTYGCYAGGKCDVEAGQKIPEHACSESVMQLLDQRDLESGDIESITISSLPPGPASGGAAPHQALVRLQGCRGSLYIDLGKTCRVQQSYEKSAAGCVEKALIPQSKHACSSVIEGVLTDFDIQSEDVEDIRISERTQGTAAMANVPFYQAQVRLNACQESLNIDLSERCVVKQAYTHGPGACIEETVARQSDHACAPAVAAVLKSLNIKDNDIKDVFVKQRPSDAWAEGIDPYYQARVQLRSCQGSLYVDMNERCSVAQSFAGGECKIAGVGGS